MRIKGGYLILGISLLLFQSSIAQSSASVKEIQNLTIIPPSPNASSLGKFGEIPVGYYTSFPNISVPLFNFDEVGLKLPIGLSYHAVGVKVEEIAPSTGLGWTLNAGGAITLFLFKHNVHAYM